MTIYDLVFIILFLTSVVTLLIAAITAIRGRTGEAVRILIRYAICFAIYMTVVSVVAIISPQRIVHLGAPRCFDDWCIAVERAEHDGNAYSVTLKLSSRARRISQREKGVHVYLTDDRGSRFDPTPAPSEIPFDVLLSPGDAVETKRSFSVPNDAHNIGVVVAHEGSFCFPGCFIIGDEANPLHKRTIVPLP